MRGRLSICKCRCWRSRSSQHNISAALDRPKRRKWFGSSSGLDISKQVGQNPRSFLQTTPRSPVVYDFIYTLYAGILTRPNIGEYWLHLEVQKQQDEVSVAPDHTQAMTMYHSRMQSMCQDENETLTTRASVLSCKAQHPCGV